MKQIKSVLNGKNINLTGDNTIITSNNFNVDKDGNMTCNNANVNGKITSNNATITGGKINISTSRSQGDKIFNIEDDGGAKSFIGTVNASIGYIGSDPLTGVYLQGEAHGSSTVRAQVITQTSLASKKKNIQKFQENAIRIIKNIDIYSYNFTSEKDTEKKHIGFAIGDGYNYSKKITNSDNTGVDNYAFTSLCCKAIQEQQEQIEELKKEINKLKGEKANG